MKIRVIGPRDQTPVGSCRIDATSRSTDIGKAFSPMILGPVKTPLGLMSKKMENAWQFSKVYKSHLDQNGNPSADWIKWAKEGFSNWKAERYPMGKGARPEYAWDGQNKLGYIEARKSLYFEMYKNAVIQSPEIEKLISFIEQAKNDNKEIVIFDFDGYDSIKAGKNLSEVLNDDKKIMGHGFVLMAMIQYGFDITPEKLDSIYSLKTSPSTLGINL